MSWNNVAKPVGTNYTNLNPQGREQYDQSSIEYDDPNVFYDGFNPNQWTDVTRPLGTVTTIRVGMATGLIMPPTYAVEHEIQSADGWIKVDKPT